MLPGGVNTMALIDPPVDAPGGYDASQSVDFRALSNFSWAFHDTGGSVAPNHSASSVTPTLADEAIDVTNTTHGSIIALFGNLISGGGPVAQEADRRSESQGGADMGALLLPATQRVLGHVVANLWVRRRS